MGLEVYILVDKKPVLVPIEEYIIWEKELWATTGRPSVLVSYTPISDECEISTVFFGMMPAVDMVFETKIFGGKFHYWERRYATWEEAERGHAKAVKMVESKLQ